MPDLSLFCCNCVDQQSLKHAETHTYAVDVVEVDNANGRGSCYLWYCKSVNLLKNLCFTVEISDMDLLVQPYSTKDAQSEARKAIGSLRRGKVKETCLNMHSVQIGQSITSFFPPNPQNLLEDPPNQLANASSSKGSNTLHQFLQVV